MESRANVVKMIERRGWTVVSSSTKSIKDVDYEILVHDNDGRIVVVYFIIECKVNVELMSMILANEHSSRHLVIVYGKSLTPDAKTVTRMNKIFKVELFNVNEFSYDLISIVPPHRIHDKRSSPSFKEWSRLPIILSSDMVVRYYGFRSGDIVEIDEDFGRGVEVALRRVCGSF